MTFGPGPLAMTLDSLPSIEYSRVIVAIVLAETVVNDPAFRTYARRAARLVYRA